jgi:AmmeMemoRadiSam system protein A
MLERPDRSRLLGLARRSIARGERGAGPGHVPREEWSPALIERRASFVTLTVGDTLRGCRGTVEPRRPLFEDVWENAWASAYTDPRFPPLAEGELASLTVAISVLSALEPIAAADEGGVIESLEPGLDGVLLRCGHSGATFLPVVWETLPEPREFVTHLKAKAGWPASFWSPDIVALRYRTETFSSTDTPPLEV